MTISVEPTWRGADIAIGRDNSSVAISHVIRGTSDEFVAQAELDRLTPDDFGDLVKESVQITERLGEEAWQGEVRWSLRVPPETGESTFTFDTGGGTQHITQSLGTVGRYAPLDEVAPDFGGAIGVTPDGVEGVDIQVPVYQFSETHYLPPELVTAQYKGLLFSLTGAVCSEPFRGFQPGEVLFLGASGSVRSQTDWELSYKFAASPNVEGLVVGEITGITKRGWDYLWVRYEPVEDKSSHTLVKRPQAVYVEQVYPYASFAGLGI
ncbi:MAG: hypothetical protein R3C01_10915 [Planctomycetaceae bacterium]